MKKNFSTVFGFFLVACCARAEAQTTATSSPRNENTPFSTISGRDSTLKSGPILINNINVRAMRDFTSSYKNPTEVKWVILPDGFQVHCFSDGIQIRILYDNKGNRVWMIRAYEENKLPHGVRHLIRSQYYDYNIFSVSEFIIQGRTIYIVKISDATKWKALRIEDGEMMCTEEYDKG